MASPNKKDYCCVPNCNSTAKNVNFSFHKFPKENLRKVYLDTPSGRELVDRRKAWMIVLKINKPITNFTKVCSLHFKKDDYFVKGYDTKGRNCLKKVAVPSLNLPEDAPPQQEPSTRPKIKSEKSKIVVNPAYIPKKNARESKPASIRDIPMSIVCSIPGCYGRNDLSENIKLYRVPADAIGCNELVINFTKKRRDKWFQVLGAYGLTEENASKFRVCSNHFVYRKPAPLFDDTHKDWVPSLFNQQSKVSNDAADTSKRGKRRKIEEPPPVPTKPVEFVNLDEPKVKSELDQPFVFVDVHKIKNQVLSPPPVKVQSPKVNVQRFSAAKIAKPCDKSNVRSCGTQTTPGEAPGVQLNHVPFQPNSPQGNTFSSEKNENKSPTVSQLYFGDIVDFVRNKMVDFNLKILGNSYKIKECTIQFQKVGGNNADDKGSSVTVLPKRLLSSDWTLLECLAKSLDLYRLQKKNESTQTGYKQTIVGKTEIVERIGVVPEKSKIGNLKKINPHSFEKVVTSPTPVKVSRKNDGITTPILPKISSVISFGDLLDDSTFKTPVEENISQMKFMEVCVPDSIPIVPKLLLKPKGLDKDGLVNGTRSTVTTKTSVFSVETSPSVQNKLGTVKVLRVILPMLPNEMMQIVKDGGKIPLKELAAFESKRISTTIPSIEVPPNIGYPFGRVGNASRENTAGRVMAPSSSRKNAPASMVKRSRLNKGNAVSGRNMTTPKRSAVSIPPKKPNTDSKKSQDVWGSLRESLKDALLKDKDGRPVWLDCNICGRLFTKLKYLAGHLKNHKEYSSWAFKCDKCPKKFPNQPELEDHRSLWHPEDKNESQNDTDKQLNVPIKQETNVEMVPELVEVKQEDVPKKPTAIRSKPPPMDNVELELRKMFQDKYNLPQSSDSEYEQEELLSSTDPAPKEESDVSQNKIQKKKKRFRNLEGSDEEDYEDLIVPKVCKIDPEHKLNEESANSELNNVPEYLEDGEISPKKVYLKREHMVDQNIVLEEMGASFGST